MVRLLLTQRHNAATGFDQLISGTVVTDRHKQSPATMPDLYSIFGHVLILKLLSWRGTLTQVN
jgi:hypothetical protein